MSADAGGSAAGRAGTGGQVRIDLLGPVSARRGAVPLALGPVRRQAVLAALILRAPAFVTYRQLLDDVWGAETPGTGHRVLSSYVYSLRKALDVAGAGAARSVIRGGRGGYRLVPEGVSTDLGDLAEQVGRIHRAKAAGDLGTALVGSGRALELFRGEPLPGLPGPLAGTERERLARQRRTLLQDRAECLVLLGRHPEALDALMAAPLAQPHDEPLAGLRMRALYGSGRQAEALDLYRETRRRLLDELGMEPGEELRRVHQAVLRGDDHLLLGRPAGLSAAGAPTAGGVEPARGAAEGRPGDVGDVGADPGGVGAEGSSAGRRLPEGDGRPGGSGHPGGTGGPGGTGSPGGIGSPDGSGGPGGTGRPDGFGGPSGPGRPGGTGSPDGSGRPGGTGRPAVPGRSDGSGPAGRAHPRPRARVRRSDLPGDTACLVGREEELALLTAPVSPEGVSVVAVDGTAGVGKTALVVRAARAIGDTYPDGCLFVDLHTHGAAHESVGPERALRRLLRAVRGSGDEIPDDLDDVADLVAAWRAATSELRLLLVVDDARSAAQVRPLLPAGPKSRVLVAGRQRLLGLDADLRLTVEPLDTGDAVGLLRELIGESRADREPEEAAELARRCGGLPLALRIASARLQNRPSWTLAFLAGRMSDDVRGLGELRAGDRSVEAAFRMSYDQLSPELRRGFRALGLAPTARFDVLTLAAMLGAPREEAEELLEDLVDASLLQQPHPGRYRLHDLVRAHARRLATEAPEEAAGYRTAVLDLYTAAGRIAGDWGPDGFPTGSGTTGPAPFPGWREASAWLKAAGGELVDVVAYAAAAGRFDHACWIAEALVDPLVHQGRYPECRAVLELALPCADLAADRRMPSALRNCMGMVDIYQGRFPQAHTWFTEALRLGRGQDDLREQARAVAGMGAAEWILGDVEEALAHLGEAVELAPRLGDDWLSGIALCNLGAVHSQQGRHEQALEHYATAVAIAEKNGRPRAIGNALCFAADAHLALGRHAEATHLLRRAVELAREAEDLPLHAASLSRLATAEHVQGSLRSAVDIHREALSTLTPGASTWLEMEVRVRLGSTYAASGRRAEARHEFETALALPGAGDHPRQNTMAREGLRAVDARGPGEQKK
ncbi:tetratricopeptide repeat protein [Streptomyces microflavus]|uniref:AfsR/SARP family transcriptional regulator n=1 Tax=Streptomyces microflavus TaxID=1919 RepID=UPI0022596AE3|nr:BTAD domain-containing putative transcriptional regulator [Streptomyces microflavus]MCX4655889.1 tetratricopeptide repeat protein [Streptomyces microflavus]